jgi:hypothetical protein
MWCQKFIAPRARKPNGTSFQAIFFWSAHKTLKQSLMSSSVAFEKKKKKKSKKKVKNEKKKKKKKGNPTNRINASMTMKHNNTSAIRLVSSWRAIGTHHFSSLCTTPSFVSNECDWRPRATERRGANDVFARERQTADAD